MFGRHILRRFRHESGSIDIDGFPADDTEFLNNAYRYLLRREPDRDGHNYHLGQLAAGADRVSVLRYLIESPEFEDLTKKAGVQWPLEPPAEYAGQLSDETQAERLQAARKLTYEDCLPYHTTDLPNGESFVGAWDLRGREGPYVGDIALDGKTVFELGPATGHLSFWMEQQGADVTAFEVGYDTTVDVVPVPDPATDAFRRAIMQTVRRINNTWWYSHQKFGSSARMVHGDIYNLPSDVGSFDIAVFGAILLHLERPLQALAQAASICNKEIVVCEPLWEFDADIAEPWVQPLPAGTENLTGWWQFSPGAVVKMLEVLGFTNSVVTFHTQRYHPTDDMSGPPADVNMFTVVARRAG